MKIYECADCGSIKIAKDWTVCSNPCEDNPMYEVLMFGKYGSEELLARINKAKNDPLKSGVYDSGLGVLVGSTEDKDVVAIPLRETL